LALLHPLGFAFGLHLVQRSPTFFSHLLLLSLTPLGAQEVVATSVIDGRLNEILAGGTPRDPAELAAMQEHVQSLLTKVLPATVSLTGASGVLVEHDSVTYVLCAAHVTEDSNRQIEITLADGRKLQGLTLGADHLADVSLIRVTTAGDWPVVPRGRSADLARGEWVLMLGHPSGNKRGRSAAARLGRVLRAPASGYLVTDCTMQGGDSGGPLFDMSGRVVGINSRISRNLSENMHAPIDAFERQWSDLLAGKVVTRRTRGRRASGPRIQLGGIEVEFTDRGPLVGPVPPDSNAARQGLLPGDRILEVEGESVQSRMDFLHVMVGREPGSKLTVLVDRAGYEVEMQLEIVRGDR